MRDVRRDRSTLMVAWRMLNKVHTLMMSLPGSEARAIARGIDTTMDKVKGLNLAPAPAPVHTRRSPAQIRQEVEAVAGRRGRTAARRGA